MLRPHLLRSLSTSKTRKCQQRKQLLPQFQSYFLRNLGSFELGLKANSLKYAVLFAKNLSVLGASDHASLTAGPFREIKASLLRNSAQLTGEACVAVSEVLNKFSPQGDEEEIVLRLKEFAENNSEQFTEDEWRSLSDNLYILDHDRLPFVKCSPKLVPKLLRKPPLLEQKIRALPALHPNLRYQYHEPTNKVLLTAEGRTLRLIAVDPSPEWLYRAGKELDKAEGLVLQVGPDQPPHSLGRHAASRDRDTVDRLIGLIKGVPQKGTNTQYVIQDPRLYLGRFKATGSFVYFQK